MCGFEAGGAALPTSQAVHADQQSIESDLLVRHREKGCSDFDVRVWFIEKANYEEAQEAFEAKISLAGRRVRRVVRTIGPAEVP